MKFPFINTAQMTKIDQLMVEKMDIRVIQMMELAGLAIALAAKKICPGKSRPNRRPNQQSHGKNILILCGKGNNGGDGINAARHLTNFGYHCTLIFPFNPNQLRAIPKHQFKIAERMKIRVLRFPKDTAKIKPALQKSHLIIDSLIGYNLKGNPRGHFATLINLTNQSPPKILAVDLPSGLDATTGKAYAPCIKAHTTLALTLPKKGLRLREGLKHVGQICVSYLTVPDSVFKQAKVKPQNWFAKNLIEKV